MLKDYMSATESRKRALNIGQKVLRDDNEKTAGSFHGLGVSQCILKDYM